jgi:hypothetical protein
MGEAPLWTRAYPWTVDRQNSWERDPAEITSHDFF